MTHFLRRVFLAATLLLPLRSGDRLDEVQAKRGGAGIVEAATSTLTTKKIRDVIPGQTIQVGATKFVKIATNQYMAVDTYICADPVLTYAGASKSFTYTGNYQTYTIYAGCQYQLEVWGAQGGNEGRGNYPGGYGGYSTGKLTLSVTTPLYIYVGQAGTKNTTAASWNGGGGNKTAGEGTGGGASDFSLKSGTWNSANHLYSRILVAGGGGGRGCDNGNTTGVLYGGGTTGGDGGGYYSCYGGGYPGTQTAGGGIRTCNNMYAQAGSFGIGGTGYGQCGGGGGGGWYGGGGGIGKGGGGGSGFIYTAATATNCPSGCLLDPSYYLSDAVTSGGNVSFPKPTGGSETGHTGAGAARITRLN